MATATLRRLCHLTRTLIRSHQSLQKLLPMEARDRALEENRQRQENRELWRLFLQRKNLNVLQKLRGRSLLCLSKWLPSSLVPTPGYWKRTRRTVTRYVFLTRLMISASKSPTPPFTPM